MAIFKTKLHRTLKVSNGVGEHVNLGFLVSRSMQQVAGTWLCLILERRHSNLEALTPRATLDGFLRLLDHGGLF